jgi:hypothetical protein
LTNAPGEIISLGGSDSNLFLGTDGWGVYRSTDEGSTAFSSGLFLHRIFCFSKTRSELFAGTDSGVFVSGNNGANWIPVSESLKDSNIASLAIKDSTLFAGTINLGIWKRPLSQMTWPYSIHSTLDSIDFGSILVGKDFFVTFSIVNTSSADLHISNLQLSSSKEFHYDSLLLPSTLQPKDSLSLQVAFTPSISGKIFGILKILSVAPEIDIHLTGNAFQAPDEVKEISKNSFESFPNPFSSKTTVSFDALESGYADVSVLNALGEQVALLYSGTLASGNHSFAFDASGLPAGTYFCVVRCGDVSNVIALEHSDE